MNTDKHISGLRRLGAEIRNYYGDENPENSILGEEFSTVLRQSQTENAWFTQENLKFALLQWADLLTEENIRIWLKNYRTADFPKKVGLILAGNIPMVGFHDVLCTVLSGHIPLIKPSSKDRLLIPFLLKKWNEFSDDEVKYETVERLQNYDAVIATGSNNTAKYLEYYFKDTLSIIRKNRTSVAVLAGDESDEELQKLGEDIFRYFGMGCRNVTHLLIPENFLIDRLFENFEPYKEVINHHKYANNYDYNRAIYLLNLEKFWDNNFVMMKEENFLFSPLSVINFKRYKNHEDVARFLADNKESIQCVVAKPELNLNSVDFGEAQKPALGTYADNIDTMRFLEII